MHRSFAKALATALLGTLLAGGAARAELSAEELAKLAQNPVGNLVNVPLQNNTNFSYGPLDRTQDILNIQPVYPIHLNDEWNVITPRFCRCCGSRRCTRARARRSRSCFRRGPRGTSTLSR